MTLGEYQEAEFHVFRCILHMRDECMAKATLHKEIEMMASDYDDVVIDGPPQSWTPYFHGTRCFPFRKFPYGLIYVELPDNIVGLAICHFRRRPGY
ncbi:hypothetical protein M4951_16630 [Blastopirellula sp. J2-11]|uniref:hypothetical protein n=1 Tax=Blastopirellula sp. J2-11 TaxID=2943192 RepID=UPI0021C6696B|nr:hypothetical protein [Blastopirellula sp. J2-11]UUO05006.1 hypothetical protein M4951_16630 [Blastopirellula sp. J2-11]